MRGKPMLLIGVLLIALGVAGLLLRRVSFTSQQDVVKVGPAQATIETRRIIEIPPVLSGFGVAAGVLLVLLGWHKQP